MPKRPAATKCRRTKVGIATPEQMVLCCESEVHSFSFYSLASVTHAWHTSALSALCETKGSRQDFPLLQVGKQGLIKVSTPDHSGCKFVHLGPPGILWASSALPLFSNPGPKGLTRKHALPPYISGRQSCNLSKKTLTGDKSGCLKFLGGRLAPTQSCLRSCSQRSVGC